MNALRLRTAAAFCFMACSTSLAGGPVTSRQKGSQIPAETGHRINAETKKADQQLPTEEDFSASLNLIKKLESTPTKPESAAAVDTRDDQPEHPQTSSAIVSIPRGISLFPGGFAYSTPRESVRPLAEMTASEREKAARWLEARRRQSLEMADRGWKYYQNSQFLNAATEYGWAIDRDPSNARLYYCRAIMFDRLERFDEAIKDLEKACKLDPNLSEARTALNHAMIRKMESLRVGNRR
jgi:tetratricopeptide (TPR) repeat protein